MVRAGSFVPDVGKDFQDCQRSTNATKLTKAAAQQIVFEPSSPIADSYIWNTKRESMFDGGVGNGKTTSGIQRLLILAKEFPGSRWAVARQTYKSLVNTTRKTFDKLCPPHWIKRDVKEEMTLANGAQILWMHLDDMSEGDLRSLEINGAFVSQAEEIQPEMWEHLDSRIGRWQGPYANGVWNVPCPAYLWGECNVNGHDWIYTRFHPDRFGNRNVQHFESGIVWEDHPTRFYCFGSSSLNKKMLDRFNPGYYEMLMAKPETWKRRWVYGSRDIDEGAIHPDFKREIHVYDADRFNPFDCMDIKSCWGWMDYGLSAPTCVLFSASTSDNYHFITQEYYKRSTPGRTITIREHASAILKLMRDNRYSVRGVYADPSVFFESTRDRRTQVTSTAQEYRECGLYLIKADNNEIASISNLQELMHVNPVLRNPVTKAPGSPRLFISSRCENLIDQIQLQRHAETRNPLTGEKEFTEERAAGIPDHAYDPLRYFANSSVWQAIRVREQPPAPQYRTTPINTQPVKGYATPSQMPRTRTTEWRQLAKPPMPNRVEQKQNWWSGE